MTALRFCAVVPTYDNPLTVRAVIERIRAHVPDVIVIDDASGPAGRAVVAGLERDLLARVVRRERNGGKGAAVRDGLRAAHDLGFTHAIQIDADGQHDLADVPRFMAAAASDPEALVLGCPVFDAGAPASRVRGRRVSRFWTDLETGGRTIADPLCGFRVYPLAAAVRAGARSDRMGFDPEIAVRMVWGGTRIVNVETRIRYLAPEEGGVSHFRMFRDNVEISWTHAQLCAGALLRVVTGRRLRPPATARVTRWQDVAEKGSVLGIRILVVLATSLGRRAVRAVLQVVAAWYVAFHPAVRRASRDYLARVRGRASLADVRRHVLCFARVTADRIFFARGTLGPFIVSTHGEEHLRALRDARRGALVVLAHLGSFEALSATGSAHGIPVSFLGYFRNARMINGALRGINPAADARLVEIRPDDPTFIFEVERLIAAGEIVGTMGDRVGEDGKAVRVPFLGALAPFPTGPYLLAAALGCPVYLGFGLYHEPNRYDLYCEPFAERVVLPRAGRAEALAAYAARYAARVEHYCRLAPYNWFNFFDYWSAP